MSVRRRARTTLTYLFFSFNDTATTEIYTLSLHDALPILSLTAPTSSPHPAIALILVFPTTEQYEKRKAIEDASYQSPNRSEEHTSELQSRLHLVCRLLLEKKKKNTIQITYIQLNLRYI